MAGLSTPAHKQTDPAKLPGQIVNPVPKSMLATHVARSRVWGHFPMGVHERYPGQLSDTATGRMSCADSLEANDPKPAALARRKPPVFAASLPDDEVGDL